MACLSPQWSWKNQLTGQNVDDAIKQYKQRDPKLKLFQFKRRALVHFAVGPERGGHGHPSAR